MCLTSYSSLSSDNLLVLIENTCHSSFHHRPDHSDLKRTGWANFKTHLADQIPFNPEFHEMAIDTCVEKFSGAILKAQTASTPKFLKSAEPRPPIPAGIHDEIRLNTRLPSGWQVNRDTAMRNKVNRPQISVTPVSTSGETTSEARPSNPSIPKSNRCGG